MRLLICAGGTGGGVYPALAVLQALSSPETGLNRTLKGGLEVLWVGGEGGMEADLVKRAGVPFTAIPAAGVHGVGLRSLPRNLSQIARGTAAARRVIRSFRPEVMFFTGGYVAVPVAVAGRTPALGTKRPATVLYVPDIEPGMALNVLARFADTITVTAQASRAYFPPSKNILVTGYPVRGDLTHVEKGPARQMLGLRGSLPVLLVFGGSKGARSINRALLNILPELLKEMQVLHISGSLDWPEVEQAREALDPAIMNNYHAYPYLHEEMGAALAAADLVVSRAGASSLGEFPLFGLPAILAPYPYAWRYQKVNAQHLVAQGAAVLLPDENLGDELLAQVRGIMHDGTRRAHMAEQMTTLAHPQAAQKIAEVLVHLAQKNAGKGVQNG